MSTLHYIVTMVSLFFGGIGVGFALAVLLRPKMFTSKGDSETFSEHYNTKPTKQEDKPTLAKQDDDEGFDMFLEALRDIVATLDEPKTTMKAEFNLDRIQLAYAKAIEYDQAPWAIKELDDYIIQLGYAISHATVSNAQECLEYVASILERKDAERLVNKSEGLFLFHFDGNRCSSIGIRRNG